MTPVDNILPQNQIFQRTKIIQEKVKEQWGLKITLEQNVGGKCGSGLGWVTGKITSCPIVEDGDDNAHSLTMLPQPPTAWINHGSRHLDAGIHFSQQISLWSRGMEYGEDLPSASPHRQRRLLSSLSSDEYSNNFLTTKAHSFFQVGFVMMITNS